MTETSAPAAAPDHIVVEGPIGVGKTTLARRLAAALCRPLMLEPTTENPFLAPFYQHRGRNALSTQLFFLLHRTNQLAGLAGADLLKPRLVADFLMAKDRLFAELVLDANELALYEEIHERLGIEPPEPDLVVYLQAPVDVLLDRVRQRGLAAEQGIEADYLERVSGAYAEFFRGYDEAPLLVVDAAEIDLVRQGPDGHFEALLRHLREWRPAHGRPRHFHPNPALL